MAEDESPQALYRRAWEHIDRQEFAPAETTLRALIDVVDPEDFMRLWELNGLLAGVLNSLARPDEATEMHRRALSAARSLGDSHAAVGPSRFMLANQYLIFGDAHDALAEAEPVPPGVGHVQCLLHSVSAQALWKLQRLDEARISARRALEAAPTDERRADMSRVLGHMLNAD